MAKEAGVKTGSMINTWLDFYAQNYASSSKDASKEIMIRYIEKMAEKLGKLDDEELLMQLNSKGLVWPLSDYYENVPDFVSAYMNEKYGRDYDWDGCIVPEFKNDYVVNIQVNIVSEYEEHDYNEIGLYVTSELWPLVSAMIVEYGRKYEKVFPENTFCFTPKMAKEIADIAYAGKDKTKEELAKEFSKVLIDFVEKSLDE